jgi:hypothetical protein
MGVILRRRPAMPTFWQHVLLGDREPCKQIEPSICAGVRPGGIDGAVAQIREICPRWLDERASSPIRQCSLQQAARP